MKIIKKKYFIALDSFSIVDGKLPKIFKYSKLLKKENIYSIKHYIKKCSQSKIVYINGCIMLAPYWVPNDLFFIVEIIFKNNKTIQISYPLQDEDDYNIPDELKHIGF